MPPRSLLDLPAELRINIYTHLFSDEWVYIDPCVYTSAPRSRTRHQGVSILQTCKQIRHEAMPLYFANVNVSFEVCRSMAPLGLINWLDTIGEESGRLLRHFRMRWNDYVDISLDLGRQAVVGAKLGHHSPPEKFHRSIRNFNCANSGSLDDVSLACLDGVESPSNPTKCVRIGEKHCITVQGTPVYEPEYWDRMGTGDFSSTLAWVLSQRMNEVLKNRSGLYLMKRDLIDFVVDADEHGSGLRWLWFW